MRISALVSCVFLILNSASALSQENPSRSLVDVLRDDPNEYVRKVQEGIGHPMSGQLDRGTIRALNVFCSENDLADVCSRGPLTALTAGALEKIFAAEEPLAAPASKPEETGVTISAQEAKVSSATLTCSAPADDEGFDRVYDVSFDGSDLNLLRGSRDAAYFEEWNGQVVDGELRISGEYLEGAGGVKKVSFTLQAQGSGYSGSGSRGPRTCEVTITNAS